MEDVCHRYPCEVAFADTDASGWAHFSKILTYVERAEHDFLEDLGIVVLNPVQVGWPRARVSCDYRSPLKFRDKIEVILNLSNVGTTSLNWRFRISKADGTLAAEGEMVSVKVDATGVPTTITDDERGKLGCGS